MPRRLTTRPERRPPTFDLAKDACEAHFRETGLTPTTEAIVARIGVQNRPLIRRALEDWLLDLPARLYRQEALPGIPPAVADQCRALWEAAVAAAGAAFATERAGFEARGAERETELAAARARIAALVAEGERRAAAHAEAEAVSGTLRAELAEAAQQREALASGLSRTQAELDQARAGRDIEQRQAAERAAFLAARLEQEHAWALQRIAEERTALEKTAHQEIGRRDQEIARLRLELARAEAGAIALREELAALRGRAGVLEQQALRGRKRFGKRQW